MLIDVPAACPDCGAIFASGFAMENTENATFTGNRSQCPHCGGMGKVIDGTFDFVGSVLRVRSAPPETIDVLRRLQAALQAAQKAETPEEAAVEASAILPEAKEEIVRASASGKGALIALLLAAMTSCSNSVKFEGKLDINRAIDQMQTMLSKEPSSGANLTPTAKGGETPKRDGSTPRQ